uniref:Acid phosphatase n=1 Tax=Panagrolaimus superbus TaxID=310955 RepID=A0A914XXJ7_9BILA
MFHLVFLFGFIVAAASADTLQHLQILYRHGDRAPEGTYKNDPYQESAWPVAWSELTDTGMQQHFIQGSKIQQKYMFNIPYLPQDYKSKDIRVQSTDVDRTLASAYSHLVGLYSASNGTYPSIQNWPTKFSPIPVHTIDKKTDHILNADPSSCLRMDELEAEQVAHGKFIQYLTAQLPLLLEISEKSGDKITDVAGLRNFYDAITIERIHNMTLPAWITDSIFNQVKTIVETCEDYIFGSAGFGKAENSELIKLKGGLLLQEMIKNMDNNGGVKLYMYSAHDTTVAAFLRTLEAKEGIIGSVSPDFAATVVVELWLAGDNTQYVKLWYSDNANTDFRDVTHTIGNCGGGNKCTYNAFKERSQKYLPGDIEKACDKL